MSRRRVQMFFRVIGAIFLASACAAEELQLRQVAAHDKGVLMAVGRQRVLVLEGADYEMGYQQGKLLAAEVKENVEAYLGFAAGRGETPEKLAEIYRRLEPYIPKAYIEEMRGIADGAGVSLDDVHLIHAIPERFHCTGAAVFGKATADGKLYHTRSLDYSLDIGREKKIQENALVTVYKPDDGSAHATLSWSGFAGCVSGMNVEGISVGEMGSRSSDESYDGLPMVFLLREVLRRAGTLDQALDIVRTARRTCGFNFIFADGKIPDACAIEVTRSLFRALRANDEQNNAPPHFGIECAVRRVNHFVSPALAATQRKTYDPAESEAGSWLGYKLISDFILANYGKLNDVKMIEMLRMYPPGHSCLHQAVFCPSDLVLWAAHAENPSSTTFAGAQNQTFYRYDLKAIVEGRKFAVATNGSPRTQPPAEAVVQQGALSAEEERYTLRDGAEAFLPKSEGFTWRMMLIEQMPQYETFLVTFPSPFESPFPENNTVYAEYYRPIGREGIPGVVVLDILGGNFEISRILSRRLASQGIGALFVQMAYYGNRRPKDHQKLRLISEDIDMTLAGVRQTIMDVRRAGAWLSSRPEVDDGKIGIAGTSLGAFIASLSAGVEPRFKKGAFVLGGGDIAKVIWEGKETARYRQKLEKQGFSYQTLSERLADVDPLKYAGNIDARGVLMVNARYDDIVPASCTTRLWEKMGKPEILWYDCNHYTMLTYIFDILGKVSEHFGQDNWGMKAEKANP